MLRLYWARNDGMTGHVFLDPLDRFALEREMAEQGMGGWLSGDEIVPGARIPPGQIDLALAKAYLRAGGMKEVSRRAAGRVRRVTGLGGSPV